MIPLADLAAYEANARTHPEDQIEALVAIIANSGFTNPLLIEDDGTIIAGHGRLEAATRLGMVEVPCVRVSGLSPAQIKALRISDNAVGLRSAWDSDLLALEVAELAEIADFDLGTLGLGGDELEALLNPPSKSEADPDEVPEPPAIPVTRPGDVWLMDKHRIVCGDSTDAETVAALMNGKSAELCLTDPPYGIGYGYNEHDDSDNDANADLVAKVFALAPAAKVWTPGGNNLARDVVRFGKAKVLYWHKRFAAAGNGLGGASTVEPVLVVGPPKHRALANDYLDFKTDRVEVAGKSLRELHPCPKPAALYAHLAEAFCAKGGAIYEPFSGSGTTLIAAEMTGRRCFAIELSPAYVDVAVKRWEDFAGRTAVLEATGQSFREVADERRALAA